MKAIRLTRTDAAILAAITEHWRAGRPQKLETFAHDYDSLNRTLPTFDELTHGLARLVAAGYVSVKKSRQRITLRATEKGELLGKEARKDARALGDVTSAIERAFGSKPWPELEQEDRSFGKLTGFEREEWDAAVAAYERWFDETANRMFGIDLWRRA